MHLTQEHVEALFGAGHTLHKKKDLMGGQLDVYKRQLIVSIKFRGDVAAVEAAVEAGAAAAERVSGVVSRHIIPNPEGDTEKMLKINALDKN